MEARIATVFELAQNLFLLHEPNQIAEQVLEILARLMSYQRVEFLLVGENSGELLMTAWRGQPAEWRPQRLSLDNRQSVPAAAVRSHQPIYIPNLTQNFQYEIIGSTVASELAVPVQVMEHVLGVIDIQSSQAGAFSQADQDLLAILANQAALALENANLQAEECLRTEELTLVSRIARRVNASLDLQETLDAIVATVAELVPCSLAEISLWDQEQEVLTLQALRSTPERAFPIGKSYPAGKGYTGWVVGNRQPLLVPDTEKREDIRPDLLPGELPFRAYLGLPLLSGEELIGTLVLIHEQANTFGEKDLRVIESLSEQAAAAIRNARLYGQLNNLYRDAWRQTRKLAALNALAGIINQPLPLQTILDQAVEKMTQVLEADGGAIRLLKRETGELVLAAYRELSSAEIPIVESFQLTDRIMDWLDQFQSSLVFQEPATDARLSYLGSSVEHIQTLAIAPLKAREKTIGIIGVNFIQSREFTPEDLELLETIGNQIGVAVERDRLHQEALEAERLAAIGRVATSVAHDLRSPLGGILRSAEYLARPELSPTTRRKLSQAIVSLSHRLISTSQQILDYVQKERLPLRRQPCVLAEFLDEVLSVLEVDFSDRGIEVEKELFYQGEVWLDGNRMAQVIYNIAANARDAMPEGGKFRVTTRQVGQGIELCFSDTGPGVPQELGDRIFDPFITYGKRQGAGLGLAIARQIIEEHGGTIHLESEPAEGATFVISLPL